MVDVIIGVWLAAWGVGPDCCTIGVIRLALAIASAISLCAAAASSWLSYEKATSGRPCAPMMLKPYATSLRGGWLVVDATVVRL
jgi:hypothetical protein